MKRWFVIAVVIVVACTKAKPVPPPETRLPTPERVVETVVATVKVPIPVIVTATPVPVIAYASESAEAPVLFDADSCAPEENPNGCSLDVGVNSSQIGLAFGWHLKWPLGGLDAGGGGCDLVILQPGWYENLWLLDARFEIYSLPTSDQEGWIKVLASQRADEQTAHYGCLKKDFEDIPQWDSEQPSPPIAPSVEPTATPVTVTRERRATGQEQTLRFAVGESAYGWRIVLDTGEVCDGGECYLPSAPSAGTVTSGVINPWPAEVEGVTPWEP